jgi:hypothetical protein
MITARDRFPSGVLVKWTDASGFYEALELPDGKRVAVTCYTRFPTAEERAATEAEATKKAADETARSRLDDLKKKIEARTATAAEKDEAVCALLGKSLAATSVSAAVAMVEEKPSK